jgi:sugar diacid utilization regulator/GAF domain-containing protein
VSGPSTTEATILALLVDDVSDADLRDALTRLLTAAGDEDQRLRIEQLGQLAFELHRARADDRRRALGLTALSDTATDLAAHLEVDELLAAICRRARLLLGTDVAYVTLRDEVAGDTYVHATDGIVSEAFRTMRLPTGTGLGGLVAATGRPEATTDYVNDERLAHDPEIDRRVTTEGLSGIVAAPLKRGREVFGVLLSGSRERRQFEPAEVSLFASLASHAAIALHNARLIARAHDTLADLARAHEALRDHAHRVERVGEIHEELAALALEGAQVGDLLETVVRHLPGEIELLAASGEPLEVRSAPAEGHAVPRSITAPILAGADELGVLRMQTNAGEGFAEDVLQRAAVLLASVLLSRQAETEARHRYRSMLLEELLTERVAGGVELRRRAVRAGIALDTEHVVLVVAPHASGERWAWLTAVRSAARRHAVVGTVGGRIVVIEEGDDGAGVAQIWSDLLRAPDGSRPTIGVAGGAMGADDVRTSHRDAGRALNILLALDRAGGSASVAELGIFGQMLGHAGAGELRAFLTRTLGPVQAYDASRGTDLLTTLEAFLVETGQLANTARRLGIHINTLYQRLARLDEVLGADWRESDRRLELHVAVRLEALQRDLVVIA